MNGRRALIGRIDFPELLLAAAGHISSEANEANDALGNPMKPSRRLVLQAETKRAGRKYDGI